MGFIAVVIAVALGIALAPVILPLLAAGGAIALVLLALGLVALLGIVVLMGAQEGLLLGWVGNLALVVGAFFAVVLGWSLVAWFLDALWRGLSKIRQDGQVLSLLVILSFGICSSAVTMAIIVTGPLGFWLWAFFLLLGVLGTVVALGDPAKYFRSLDLSWDERLGFTMGLFSLALVISSFAVIVVLEGF